MEELEAAAGRTVAVHVPEDAAPAALLSALHAAVMFHAVTRLGLMRAAAQRGDVGLLPSWFNLAAARASLLNMTAGAAVQPNPLGLRLEPTPRQTAGMARRLLVGEVYALAARESLSLTDALPRALPEFLELRTWQDWQRDAAKARGVKVADLASAVAAKSYPLPAGLVPMLWRLAYNPR